jgi:hypothetical protein
MYSTSPSPNEDVLLLGTLGGVYKMVHPDQPGAHWELLGTGLPHTLAIDLHYDYTDNVLVAGTLGRGAWTLSNPFSSLAAPIQIGPITAGANTISAGSTVSAVAFYLDSNGDGVWEPGTDVLLGYGTQTNAGTWTSTVSLAGNCTVFAVASDSFGIWSDPLAITFQVI